MVWSWGAITEHNFYSNISYNAFSRIQSRGSPDKHLPGNAFKNLCQDLSVCQNPDISASSSIAHQHSGGLVDTSFDVCDQLEACPPSSVMSTFELLGANPLPNVPAGSPWMPGLTLDLRPKQGSALLAYAGEYIGAYGRTGSAPARPGADMMNLYRALCEFPQPGLFPSYAQQHEPRNRTTRCRGQASVDDTLSTSIAEAADPVSTSSSHEVESLVDGVTSAAMFFAFAFYWTAALRNMH